MNNPPLNTNESEPSVNNSNKPLWNSTNIEQQNNKSPFQTGRKKFLCYVKERFLII
jgi:hypothetical protein